MIFGSGPALFVCPACGQRACMLKPDKKSRPYFACACGTKIFPRGTLSLGVMLTLSTMVEEMGRAAFEARVHEFEAQAIAAFQSLSVRQAPPSAPVEA